MSILGLGLYHEHEVRRAELASAVHEARNLAKSLVQHIEDTVDLANSALLGIAYRLETDGSSPQTLERLQGFLHLRKRSLPWVRGLFVYGPDGAWLATTEPVRLADYNNADRSYFQYHQSNADPSAHVGKPVRSRSSGVWIITISAASPCQMDHLAASSPQRSMLSISLRTSDASTLVPVAPSRC